MNVLVAILALLTALLPVADRGLQVYQQRSVTVPQVAAQVAAQSQTAAPKPQIVFYEGRWWKWDGQKWWVWSPTQVAQGGSTYAVR